MRGWPQSIRLFMAHGMTCVGCPVGRFHTLEEACAMHAIALEPFLVALAEIMTSVPRPAETDDGDRRR